MNRIHPDDGEMVKKALLGDQSSFRLRYRILREDGSYRVVENSSSRIDVRDKQVTVNFIRDVTERQIYLERLMALHRHATELNLADSEDDVARITFDIVKSVLGFDRGSFSVVVVNKLVHIHVEGVELGYVFKQPLDGPGITVRALKTGKTQLVPDTSKDPDFVQPYEGEVSRSELAVPIIFRGEPLGVINLESLKDR